jgi:hypothetical protein
LTVNIFPRSVFGMPLFYCIFSKFNKQMLKNDYFKTLKVMPLFCSVLVVTKILSL